MREGRHWLELALANATDISTLDRAITLAMIGFLAREMGDLAIAQSLLEESLRIYQELDDLGRQAWALNVLSMIALSRGEPMETYRLASQSAALFRSIGSELEATGPLLLIGEAAYLMHDYERATGYGFATARALWKSVRLQTAPTNYCTATVITCVAYIPGRAI